MAKAIKNKNGTWTVKLYLGKDESGHQQRKNITAATKKEAEYRAALYQNNTVVNDSYTVREAMQMYIDSKRGTLSPTTINGYMTVLRSQIDDIGHIKIKNLDSRKVQSWISSLSATRSAKTVANAHGLFTASLRFLDIDKRFKVKLPQKEVKDLYVPSDEEVQKLIDYFKGNNTDMLIAVYLAAFGTLRRGEICALTAADVEGNTILINKVMVRDGSEWIIKNTPKTVASNRRVEYPQFVIDQLPKSGRLVNMYPDSITDNFIRTIKKLGLPHFRFHSLRSYAASIMHAISIPDQYIMQRGGWSSDKVLKSIYRKSLDEYQKKFTDQANNYFEEKFNPFEK